MSKAEKRAWAAYPDFRVGCATVVQNFQRQLYQEGYKQAEKDLLPIIGELVEAILFDWDDKVEIAKKAIKKREEYL